jgi:hypothetical protein
VTNALCIKFDGSLLKNGAATASCVLYTKEHGVLRLRREHIIVKTSGEAEQMGFILGVDTLIQEYRSYVERVGDCSLCRIYGDSQVLFKHLRGKTNPKSNKTAFLSGVAKKGLERLSLLGFTPEMYWVPRKCNVLADILCRTAYNFAVGTFTSPSYFSETENSKQNYRSLPCLRP